MRIRLSPRARLAIAYAHDLGMAAAAFVLSLWLRLGDELARVDRVSALAAGALFVVIAAVVFRWFGLYRGIWRFASLPDLARIVRAVTLAILVFVPALFLVTRLEALPRSMPVIAWFVLILLLAGPRILYRLAKDGRFDLRMDPTDGRVPVLLVGAGREAEQFIEANDRPRMPYRAVGIVDDSAGRQGRALRGVDVLGTIADLPAVVEQLAQRERKPQRVVVTRPDLAGERLERLMDEADRLGLTVARLPRLTEITRADASAPTVRPIALEDLLGRPQTVLDRGLVAALIEGRRVLV